MKILVFGASGKTGSLLVTEALALGFEVIAYVRRKESITAENPNLKIIEGQLNDKEKLKYAISGSDACISTLGGSSLTKHNIQIIQGIDNIVTLMEEEKVKRLIYLSSIGAGNSRFYMPQPIRFLIADIMLRVPLADHNANESRISQSKLDWTVIRPGGLTNGPKTGNLKHGFESMKMKGNGNISRSNVAAFMLEQLNQENYLQKSVWLHE